MYTLKYIYNDMHTHTHMHAHGGQEGICVCVGEGGGSDWAPTLAECHPHRDHNDTGKQVAWPEGEMGRFVMFLINEITFELRVKNQTRDFTDFGGLKSCSFGQIFSLWELGPITKTFFCHGWSAGHFLPSLTRCAQHS